MIRSLADSSWGSVIMTLGFTASAGMIVWQTQDTVLTVLLIGGLVASVTRLVVVLDFGRKLSQSGIQLAQAMQWERRFALAYVAFAGVLGLFGARVMLMAATELHTLMICLLVGYGAGVAASIALRPKIAVPSMIIAIAPAILACFSWKTITGCLIGALVASFLAGGIHSLRARHKRAAKDIGMQLTLAALAGKDPLTTLANRFALRQWFENRAIPKRGATLIAVHCLDLNGFKPVNDKYGHPTGDALLLAVSNRLSRAIRDSDMVCRLGGDEFVVVQCVVAEWDDAEVFGLRLAAAIAQPFQIEERSIEISTSIGYVVAEAHEDDLERLLGIADEALYAGKRSGRTVTGYNVAGSLSDRSAA